MMWFPYFVWDGYSKYFNDRVTLRGVTSFGQTIEKMGSVSRVL